MPCWAFRPAADVQLREPVRATFPSLFPRGSRRCLLSASSMQPSRVSQLMPRAWELVRGGGGGVMEGHREKWPALRGSGRSQETPEGGAVAWVSVGFRGRGCQERPHPQLLGPGTGSGREGGRRAEGRWEVAQGLKEPERWRTRQQPTGWAVGAGRRPRGRRVWGWRARGPSVRICGRRAVALCASDGVGDLGQSVPRGLGTRQKLAPSPRPGAPAPRAVWE